MVARKTGGKQWSGQIGTQLQHLAQQLGVLQIEIPTKPSGHNPGVATSFNTEAWLFMLKIFDDALPRTDFLLEADMFHDPEKKVRMRPITSFSRTIVICMVSLTRPCVHARRSINWLEGCRAACGRKTMAWTKVRSRMTLNCSSGSPNSTPSLDGSTITQQSRQVLKFLSGGTRTRGTEKQREKQEREYRPGR